MRLTTAVTPTDAAVPGSVIKREGSNAAITGKASWVWDVKPLRTKLAKTFEVGEQLWGIKIH